MASLGKAKILGASGRLHEVPCPELAPPDGYLYVRSLLASDLPEITRLTDEKNEARVMAGWAALSICDQNGKRLFTADDLDDLLKVPLAVLRRVTEAVMTINGLDEEGETARKKSARRSG